MADKVPFAILDFIVTNGPLLTQTEEFLHAVGKDSLAQSLEKLEQDVGLQVFNDIGDENSEDQPAEADLTAVKNFIGNTDTDRLPRATELLESREGVPLERLIVLETVISALELHGAPFLREYADMLDGFKALLPASMPDPLISKSISLDLI